MDDGIAIDFGETGLVPAVAQDAETGEVLMLAYVSPRRSSEPARRASTLLLAEPRGAVGEREDERSRPGGPGGPSGL